ncbi:hypothetical protein CRENBAI_008201 [Crenichthys baileyi]|uniref:Uncharacterized protein n=1 Tax=Crenichthys baileyi TaxID=28760 RepID=A0AAV9QQF5_9TELE
MTLPQAAALSLLAAPQLSYRLATLWLSNPSLTCLFTLSLRWQSHQSHAGERQNRCSTNTSLSDGPNPSASASENYLPSLDFHLHPPAVSDTSNPSSFSTFNNNFY